MKAFIGPTHPDSGARRRFTTLILQLAADQAAPPLGVWFHKIALILWRLLPFRGSPLLTRPPFRDVKVSLKLSQGGLGFVLTEESFDLPSVISLRFPCYCYGLVLSFLLGSLASVFVSYRIDFARQALSRIFSSDRSEEK